MRRDSRSHPQLCSNNNCVYLCTGWRINKPDQSWAIGTGTSYSNLFFQIQTFSNLIFRQTGRLIAISCSPDWKCVCLARKLSFFFSSIPTTMLVFFGRRRRQPTWFNCGDARESSPGLQWIVLNFSSTLMFTFYFLMHSIHPYTHTRKQQELKRSFQKLGLLLQFHPSPLPPSNNKLQNFSNWQGAVDGQAAPSRSCPIIIFLLHPPPPSLPPRLDFSSFFASYTIPIPIHCRHGCLHIPR